MRCWCPATLTSEQWLGDLGDGKRTGDYDDPRLQLIEVVPAEIRYVRPSLPLDRSAADAVAPVVPEQGRDRTGLRGPQGQSHGRGRRAWRAPRHQRARTGDGQDVRRQVVAREGLSAGTPNLVMLRNVLVSTQCTLPTGGRGLAAVVLDGGSTGGPACDPIVLHSCRSAITAGRRTDVQHVPTSTAAELC